MSNIPYQETDPLVIETKGNTVWSIVYIRLFIDHERK